MFIEYPVQGVRHVQTRDCSNVKIAGRKNCHIKTRQFAWESLAELNAHRSTYLDMVLGKACWLHAHSNGD